MSECCGNVRLHVFRDLCFDSFFFGVHALRDFGLANQANHGLANERMMTTNKTMDGEDG